MHAIRHALFAALLAAAAQQPAFAQSMPVPPTARPAAGSAADDDRRVAPRYFEIVNASHDSAQAIAIAPAGSGVFDEIDIGQPLRGGVTSVTFDVPAGGCLRDLRVTFRGNRTLLYPSIDLCRARSLRLSPKDGRQLDAGGDLAARTAGTRD